MSNQTRLRVGAMAVVTLIALNLAAAPQAEAGRKECLYKGFDPFANMWVSYIEGHAKAVKKSWACNRAYRRCLSRLNHVRRDWPQRAVRCQKVR